DDALRAEIADVAFIVPVLGGLADDAAAGIPLAAALELLEQHQAPHECARVARRIDDLRPAGRLIAEPEIGDVGLVLPRVVPQEVAEKAAARQVDFERHSLDADDS